MRFHEIAPLRGQVFEARAPDQPEGAGRDDVASMVPLTLAEATELAGAPRFESFSLQWDGPLAQPLAQATYLLAHPRLGEIAIFIVPIGRGPEHFRYESIFCVERDPA